MPRGWWSTAAAMAGLVLVGAAQQPVWSPAPRSFLELKAGITPAELARLRPALMHDRIAHDDAIGMGPLSEMDAAKLVDRASIGRVALGALGSGYFADFQRSPECGATGNCPMVLLSAAPGGGFVATDLFGWGFAAAPASGPVPEIYSVAREGGSHDVVSRKRWSGTKFVADGEEETREGETVIPEAGKPTFPLPRWNTGVSGSGVEADLFIRLAPALLASLERHMPAAAAQSALEQARSGSQPLVNGLRPIVVETGACDPLGNCPLFVFRSMEGSARRPMILDGVAGWAINLRFYNASLSSRELLIEATLARRIRADAVVLTQYREASSDRFGPDRLVAYGCETATGDVPADPPQWSAAGLLLTPGCGSSPAPRSTIRVDRTPVETVLRDASGAIWGAAGTASPCDGRLFRWSADRWVQQPVPNANTGLRAILPGDGGGVIAEWSSCRNAGPFATWQRNSVTRTLPGGSWPENAVQTPLGLIVPAPEGQAPGLALWRPSGPPRRLVTFAAGQNLPAGGPLHAITDASGDVWFYSSLIGAVVLRNGTFHALPKLPGFPPGPIAGLWPWDASHLAAVALTPGGVTQLFIMDTQDGHAAPASPPQPHAFDHISEIFRAAGDIYLASGRALWRLQAGQWQEIIPQLDPSCCFAAHPWVATAAGIWIGADPDGLWYVPRHGAPVLVDWTHGLPMHGWITKLFALSSHEVLAQTGGQTAAFPLSAVLHFQPLAHDALTTPVSGMVTADARHYVWGLADNTLAEWDGHAWKQHPLPGAVRRGQFRGAAADSQGRIWLMPNCNLGPTAIYQPGPGRWQLYSYFRGALVRQGAEVRFPDAGPFLDPQYGPRGQIAFFGPCGGLNYYNGKRWRLWQPGELLRLMPGTGPDAEPAFDAAGDLILNMIQGAAATWRWDGTAWQRLPETHPLPPVAFSPFRRPYPPAPPPGCNTPWPESLQFDRLGRGWWTAAGNVYVGTAGQCRVVLPASDEQPFMDGRPLARVTLDAAGNALLQSTATGEAWLVPAAVIGSQAAQASPARQGATKPR